ncbi:MAG TPA: PEP-CTERM sorting domain-containing protein [Pyrinomonadaceae bacterium]|nr:PEP-CTERM sorting domain-containing protein [Pyrinomonadaceae bacterium]
MINRLLALAKPFALGLFAVAFVALAQGEVRADPVTFSTSGVFSGSGTNTITFTNGTETTTLTFNSTTNSVNTPAGTQFGDILATSTAAPGSGGPTVGGNFTLTFTQVAPPGTGSLVGTLSGTLGFNSGIATLTFNQTSVTIGGFTYTVNPTYTLALPASGAGGSAGTGTTTIQGTVTGSPVPEPASMVLLGMGLTGVAAAARKRRNRNAQK